MNRTLLHFSILSLLIGAQLAAPFSEAKAPPLPNEELTLRLGALLDSLVAQDQFSGVVVVAQGGAPMYERACGMADREGRVPNRVETAFNLGSINKTFTHTAIQQLALQGRLALDSPLVRYWPDYPNPDVARRVTIRQLLGHSSGIGGNIFGAPPDGKRSDIRHNRDFLPLFALQLLEFEPGARKQYSNAGYVVLGILVERLSGTDYYEYVRRNIYEPAGMTQTGSYPVDSLPSNAARGYTRGPDPEAPGPLSPNTELLPGRGSAAGGGYSTASDLLRFVGALRAGKIPGGPPAGIGIAGGAPGINAVVDGDLPGEYDVVVLANLDPPAAENVAAQIRAWLGVDE